MTPLFPPANWASKLVAGTNPSRPTISPASLVQDLKELPAMVRDVGRLLSKPKKLLSATEVANQHLAVRFGWVPLVRDLNQLLNLQSAILKRVSELRRLYSGRGLRRRMKLAEDTTNTKITSNATQTFGGIKVQLVINVKVERKQWATIRWRPTLAFSGVPNDIALHNLARQVALGLTPEGLAKGAWEVLPWSWLVGWFTNIGDLILNYSNTVPATYSNLCCMSQLTATYVPGPTVKVLNAANSTIEYRNGARYSYKRRDVDYAVAPGFNVPFIDTSRLSILGSLYVQRFMR